MCLLSRYTYTHNNTNIFVAGSNCVAEKLASNSQSSCISLSITGITRCMLLLLYSCIYFSPPPHSPPFFPSNARDKTQYLLHRRQALCHQVPTPISEPICIYFLRKYLLMPVVIWYTSVMPSFRWVREEVWEYKASLGYIVRSHLKIKGDDGRGSHSSFICITGAVLQGCREKRQAVKTDESAHQTVCYFSRVVAVIDLKALHKSMEPVTKPWRNSKSRLLVSRKHALGWRVQPHWLIKVGITSWRR